MEPRGGFESFGGPAREGVREAVTGMRGALLMESRRRGDSGWVLCRDFTGVNVGEPAVQQ
ncbi:hypothetical protein ACIQXM_06190 [Arthrobacter sp. NPDC097144]|uniref:hypothetical protein n=1 Tax=Arthrobacter sp. NPDC097144 TaxID=3363946 RepID=UPI003818432B